MRLHFTNEWLRRHIPTDPNTEPEIGPVMHKLALEEICKSVEQRVSEGDCPTTPAVPTELLEDAITQLRADLAARDEQLRNLREKAEYAKSAWMVKSTPAARVAVDVIQDVLDMLDDAPPLPSQPQDAKPIDVMLFCPKCGHQHVDAPEPGTDWDNPPHKSHLCHKCGTVWRPADVPTNGVAQAKTVGSKDTFKPGAQPQVSEAGEAKDAARYRRLRVLGCAPSTSPQLERGTVLCFTNLDEFVDADLAAVSTRGEAHHG